MARSQRSPQPEWPLTRGTDLMHLAWFYVQDRTQAAWIAREAISRDGILLAARPEPERTLSLLRTVSTIGRGHRMRGTERPIQPLLRAVLDLPLPMREIAVLSYYLDLDIPGVAHVTQQTEASVETSLQQVRAMLVPHLPCTGKVPASG